MPHVKTIDTERDRTNPVVELRVRADPRQLPVLRAVAATIAMQENFDLDAVADIRLAMDEACTRLIMRAANDAILLCRFQHIDRTLRVAVSTTLGTETWGTENPGQRTFGWHVLNTLTDSVDMTQENEPDSARYLTTIEFTKADGSGP